MLITTTTNADIEAKQYAEIRTARFIVMAKIRAFKVRMSWAYREILWRRFRYNTFMTRVLHPIRWFQWEMQYRAYMKSEDFHAKKEWFSKNYIFHTGEFPE
jgi:hypothetical protein